MKITIRNLQSRIPLNQARIRKAALRACSETNILKSGSIAVIFVTDRYIRKLNLKYLRKNRPTDVMAFDISGQPGREINADIFISVDTALRQSKLYKTTPLSELFLYVIHGVLHLAGYDDNTRKNRLAMQKKQEAILKKVLSKNAHPKK